MSISKTPSPPYYAVIFTSIKKDEDKSYEEMSKKMVDLVSKEDGFLGFESARENSFGITISYWRDLDSIKRWKNNLKHKEAQRLGKEIWYKDYKIRIAKIERDYGI